MIGPTTNRLATERRDVRTERSDDDGPESTRRQILAGAGMVGVAGLAGCLGDITEYESRVYRVRESVTSDAGYELSDVDRVVIEEPVGVDPIEETVVATNHVVEYEKTLDIGPLGEQQAGVFVAFATPQVSAFGREFNPVAEMDAEELVDLVQDGYEGLSGIERDTEAEIELLGETVTRTRFEAEATFDGAQVDVDLHVTEAAATDEDLVVTVGVYPRELRTTEEDHTLAMIAGVDVDAASAADTETGGSGGSDDGDDGIIE